MQRNHLRMEKIVNEVGLSRTQKYPNYSVTMSWDRDCCVYRTVIIFNLSGEIISSVIKHKAVSVISQPLNILNRKHGYRRNKSDWHPLLLHRTC